MGQCVNLAQKIAAFAESDSDFDSVPAVLEALDALRVAITVFDRQHRLVYANAQYNYLYRSLPLHETLIGHSYEALVRLEIEGGEIAHSALLDGVEAYVARRIAQFTPGEYRPVDVPRADGRVIEIKARQARSGGWIALLSDVTDARHNFMRLEDAIALSADAFAFFDARDRLAMCNALFAQLHGAAQQGELKGWTFSEIVERSARSGRFVIEGGIEDWLEHRHEAHQAPAGALTVTSTGGCAYLVRDRITRDGGRVIVFTDVTDRRRAESTVEEQTRALKQTRRALARTQTEVEKNERYLADLNAKLGAAEAEASTAKTTFLRTMSHELKTPLNAIIGFSDLLRQMSDRVTPEQVAEYAGLIHQGGHNLLKMIVQILDLTKIAAGRYDLHRAAVDAGAILWNVKGDFENRALAKGLSIDADSCPLGFCVRADENTLRAMCSQLVENAVHFTPQGGRITMLAETIDGRARLMVHDNGPGVAPQDLARILKPFEQSAGNGTTQHSYGAGLGLTLVKELAELNGGTLRLDSKLGAGFTATIELPAA